LRQQQRKGTITQTSKKSILFLTRSANQDRAIKSFAVYVGIGLLFNGCMRVCFKKTRPTVVLVDFCRTFYQKSQCDV